MKNLHLLYLPCSPPEGAGGPGSRGCPGGGTWSICAAWSLGRAATYRTRPVQSPRTSVPARKHAAHQRCLAKGSATCYPNSGMFVGSAATLLAVAPVWERITSAEDGNSDDEDEDEGAGAGAAANRPVFTWGKGHAMEIPAEVSTHFFVREGQRRRRASRLCTTATRHATAPISRSTGLRRWNRPTRSG